MKKKEVRTRVKTLLSELEQLRERLSDQSRGSMPNYVGDIYSGRLSRWCPLFVELSLARYADDGPKTMTWLGKISESSSRLRRSCHAKRSSARRRVTYFLMSMTVFGLGNGC